MSRRRSPMTLKTEKAHKLDAIAIKDRQRRVDEARGVTGVCESAKLQMPNGSQFVMRTTELAMRKHAQDYLDNTEQRIADALKLSVTWLRLIPSILVKDRDAILRRTSRLTDRELDDLINSYRERGYYNA